MTVVLGGCDYLGLSRDRRAIDAACAAAERYGLSASASRITTGTLDIHIELERSLAGYLGVDEVAVVADGALANRCAFEAVDARGVCYGDRCHPTLGDAGPPHDPLAGVYVSDTVEPTDAWTIELDRLGDREVLILDDCHGVGVLGGGKGIAGLMPDELKTRSLITGTLAKAFGAGGGFVAGPRTLVERARAGSTYCCTTALSPVLAAAALASLRIMSDDPSRLARVHRLSDGIAGALGCATRPVPVFGIVGDVDGFAEAIGPEFSAPFMRYPGGPASGYVRVVVTHALRDEQHERLASALARSGGGSAGGSAGCWRVLDAREGGV